MDQGAWDLLTASAQSGPEKAWNSTSFGPACSEYAGEEILPGEVFDLGYMRRLFDRLRSINFCPCRDTEVSSWGLDAMESNMIKYVSKNMTMHREHAKLSVLAHQWVEEGRPKTRLLNRAMTKRWQNWLISVENLDVGLTPTKEQVEFVRRSQEELAKLRKWLTASSILVMLLIVAGAIASGVFGIEAIKQRAVAAQERDNARASEQLAIASKRQAVQETAAILVWSGLVRLQALPLSQIMVGELRIIQEDIDLLQAIGGYMDFDDQLIELYRSRTSSGIVNSGVLVDETMRYIRDARWHPQGNLLATASDDRLSTIRVWSLAGDGRVSLLSRLRPPLQNSSQNPFIGSNPLVVCKGVTWTSDGSMLAGKEI